MVGISTSMAPARFCSSRTICSIFLQHPKAHRQPGIAARRLLADHAAAQHQLVGDDLRFLRIVAQNGHEILGKAHGNPCFVKSLRPFKGNARELKTAPAEFKDPVFRQCHQVAGNRIWTGFQLCPLRVIFNSTTNNLVLASPPIRTRPRCCTQGGPRSGEEVSGRAISQQPRRSGHRQKRKHTRNRKGGAQSSAFSHFGLQLWRRCAPSNGMSSKPIQP